MWLPRWETIKNPNCSKIETASEPDSLFNLGIRRFDFHRYQHRWIFHQSERCQILSIEMKSHRFLQIPNNFIQAFTLCHNGNFHTFSDIT